MDSDSFSSRFTGLTVVGRESIPDIFRQHHP